MNLINAMENDNIKRLRRFLLHATQKEKNDTLLWASYYGHTATVKLVIACGADVHSHENDALRWALQYGRTAIVKLLLTYGADVLLADDETLRLALKKGRIAIIKLLITYGVDVYKSEVKGEILKAINN